ncbi:biopolymer transporter ExbD, partial [Glaesserella parasuis]|nr:biopolymer transporter ExbD [Glaesserella parasuis]
MPILTQSIPLELPTANVEKKDEAKDIFRVAINPTGIYLGEKLVNEEELKQSFLTKFQENKNTVIAISADISVEYQHIVKVLELAQNVGLTKIGFVTQPTK